MVTNRTKALQALLDFVEELRLERGSRWGWKKEVAQELGMSESAIGKLQRGERGVSVATVEQIAKRHARYRAKLEGVAEPAAAPTLTAREPSTVRAAASDPAHWLFRMLDAWAFEGVRRETVIAHLEAADAPLQPATISVLVNLWLRIERLEAAATAAPAAHHGEPGSGSRLKHAKPAKRLK